MITGMNASVEGIRALREGRILATWDQRTVDSGNALAWAAHEIVANGKKLPQTVHISMPRYDSDDVSEWRSPEELLAGPEKVSLRQDGDAWFLETTPTNAE